MRIRRRLILLRLVYVVLLSVAPLFIATRYPKALGLVLLPIVKARRWYLPYIRVRRALDGPARTFHERGVALRHPDGWKAGFVEDTAKPTVRVEGPGVVVQVMLLPPGDWDARRREDLGRKLLERFEKSFRIREVTPVRRAVGRIDGSGLEATVTRWNEADQVLVLSAPLPDGGLVSVLGVAEIGLPEDVFDCCVRSISVSREAGAAG